MEFDRDPCHAELGRETTFDEIGEGSLRKCERPDCKLPRRGRAIFAQPGEESIDLPLGDTEVPLPAGARGSVERSAKAEARCPLF
jgi:hypothetical protein